MVRKFFKVCMTIWMVMLMMLTVMIPTYKLDAHAEGTNALDAVNSAHNFDSMDAALRNPDLGLDLSAYDALGTTEQVARYWDYEHSDPVLFNNLVTKMKIGMSLIYERPIDGYKDSTEIQAKLDELLNYYTSSDPELPQPVDSTVEPFDEDFFPIAVWLQNPKNAQAYKDIGINTFIGLWDGLSESALNYLYNAGMKLILGMDPYAKQLLLDSQKAEPSNPELVQKFNKTVIGWAHTDEPDNAQYTGSVTRTYGPPIQPRSVITRYNQIKALDPTRPVYLNLSQGVSWFGWYGRGVDTGNIEKYPQYIKGTDIISFDIYPVNSTNPEVKDKLWMVADGIDNLREWSNDSKPAWVWIETTRYDQQNGRPSPEQVKAEVWMALVHGAKGIGYFCHQFTPFFIEAGPLHDDYADIRAALKSINEQITSLAPVLNSDTTSGYAIIVSSNPDVPVDIMTKDYNGAKYIFAVNMRNDSTTATFKIASGGQTVEVIGEDREIDIVNGQFSDDFSPYAVHLYKISDVSLDQLDDFIRHGASQGAITNHGVLNSLLVKVEHAQKFANEGNNENVFNQLRALQNQVKDQAGENIVEGFAELLINNISILMDKVK